MKPGAALVTHPAPRSLIMLVFTVLGMAALAQANTLVVGTVTGLPGTSVDVPVSFTPGTTPVSSLQFDMTLPSSLGYVSAATGNAATSAGKSASGNAVSGGVRVLVFGLNQNAIGSGAVAIIKLAIAGGTPAGSLTLGITRITGTTPDATAATVSGISGRVTISTSVDTAPPTISNVAAGSITATSAVITWTTNEAADTQVEYGPTTPYAKSTVLASAKVTSHSQILSGLAPGTTYHYRVRSRDAAGNLAVSGDYTFTTAAAGDTAPPVISAVKASGITASQATINWITNEPADTQVEYGKTVSYGQATAIDTAKVTAHSQNLSGLTANSVYHYRVKSRDAAGNLSVSGNFTFTTPAPDYVAPIITSVKAEPADQSAIITWTTDEPATSLVDWGATSLYGQQSTAPKMATSHWVRVTGLSDETQYHFRVKSADASGNYAVSQDFIFTTARSEPRNPVTLYLPTLSMDQYSQNASGPGEDEYTGIALANLDTADANVVFMAYDTNGNPVAGPDIRNPVQRSLKPGEQLPVLDYQVFGTGTGRIGWMRIESTADRVSGFFLTFDGELNVLDGATASAKPVSSFILPEAGEQGLTRIYVANPNSETVSVTFRLTRSNGTERGNITREIASNSALAADLYADLFPGAQADPSDYLLVTSSGAVVPYEMLGEAGMHIRVLSGQDLGKNSMRVYSPQYAVGGLWRSTLSVINLDSRPGRVTMRFIPQGSTQPAATKSFDVAANGKIYLSDQNIFVNAGASAPDTVISGYIDIYSDGIRLGGSVTFGDSQGQSFASALPLVDELRNSVVFSHVASNETYFTGLALLNPSLSAAMATIDLYDANGNRESSVVQTVPGQARIARVLTEFFPELVYQNRTSGYIRVASNVPLACFALFGTNNLSVLSAIPAQPAP